MAILLVHTGGTISMERADTGFAPKPGLVEDFVRGPLDGAARGVEIETLSPLIDSANATPEDWNRIARLVAAAHDRVEGVVVTHGTDTLAFTAAALAFALEGLGRPVILTGSMIPLSLAGSDGVANLREALDAVPSTPPGVWVRFAGRTLPGTRVYKRHTLSNDAFAAIPSARPPRREGGTLHCHEAGEPDVAIIAVAPGMTDSLLHVAATRCDGVVLRCFGSGTVPDTPALRRALAAAEARRIPVLAVSQCAEGGIALGTYAAGRALVEHGVVDGRDMTVEAATAKMVYALSETAAFEVQKSFLGQAIAGEI